MIPSRKTILTRLDWLDKLERLTPDQAATIVRQAMEYAEGEGIKPTLNQFTRDAGIRSNLRAGSRVDRALHVMDVALETFGVEYIPSNEDTVYSAYGLAYVNTGDTYVPTVIYDHGKDKWEITSWGDIVEWDQERFGE